MVKYKYRKKFLLKEEIFYNKMEKKIHCSKCSGIWHRKFMRKIKHPSGAVLDVCDHCGGMWLDRNEVKLLYNFSQKIKNQKK